MIEKGSTAFVSMTSIEFALSGGMAVHMMLRSLTITKEK